MQRPQYRTGRDLTKNVLHIEVATALPRSLAKRTRGQFDPKQTMKEREALLKKGCIALVYGIRIRNLFRIRRRKTST